MNYSEKLKNPKWQKMRLKVLNRDKFTCQLCNDKETTLHVHHKEYIKGNEPWEYPIGNFQTLCKHCHYEVEFLKKNITKATVLQINKSISIIDKTRLMFISLVEETCIHVFDENDNSLAIHSIEYFGTKTIELLCSKAITHGK